MNEFDKELKRISELINYVGRAQFEFGIFNEDGTKIETIKVLNLDGSISEQQMTLSEIMYLTEKGTITIPAKPILGKIFEQFFREYPKLLDEIIEGIEKNNWSKKEIREKLQWFNTRINYVFIPNAVQMIISSDNVISGILNEEEDQNYTFDLKKLKKFIKINIFFTI